MSARVHRSEIAPLMSVQGHSRPIDTRPAVTACPFRAESGHVGTNLAKSALCQNRL